jgi:hypothetical protein
VGHFWNDIFTATTSRHTRNTAKNTKEANRLARLHHAEITHQNAALLKVQTDALHYQRYSTDPSYRTQVDAAWEKHRATQAQLYASGMAMEQARAEKNSLAANWALRLPLLSLVVVAIALISVVVWLPQFAVGKARRSAPSYLARDDLAHAWARSRELAVVKFRPRPVAPPS